MSQLRASVFIDGPHGEESEVSEEIPRLVASDAGTVTLQAGKAVVAFSSRAALMALLAAAPAG